MEESRFFHLFTKPKSDEHRIQELIDRYGEGATLKEIMEDVKNNSPYVNLPYVCPKCQGKGYLVREYNGYPAGLPDSGWVYEPAYDYSVCDVCDGMGYTETEVKPIVETKIVGYK